MTKTLFTIALVMLLSACNLERASTPVPETQPPQPPTATITATPAGAVPNPVSVGTQLPAATATRPPTRAATTLPQLDLPLPQTPTANAADSSTDGDGSVDLPPLDRFIKQDNINLSVGQTLVVDYTVQLDDPGNGSVFFVLTNPSGDIVWQHASMVSEEDSAEISINSNGIHELLVAFQNASGGFQIDGSYSVSYALR